MERLEDKTSAHKAQEQLDKNKRSLSKDLEQDDEDLDEDDEEEQYLQSLQDNPEKALEKTVEQLLRNKFYQGEDKLWYIYDDESKKWNS